MGQSNKVCLIERGVQKSTELTFKGIRMGNQENIPGECVSGFIPASRRKRYLFVTKATDTQTALLSSKFDAI